MSSARLRPRFRQTVPLEMEEILKRCTTAKNAPDAGCRTSIIDHHIILRRPPGERHYWSPQLSLELEAQREGTLIRGLYGPKPAVWTMFMFFYSAVGFFTLMGLMYGLSQTMISQPPWALWTFPTGVLIILVIYLIARTGRNMGRDQMHTLHQYYNETLGTDSGPASLS